MSEQIIRVLDYLAQKFGIAIDWTADNILPQVQRIYEHCILYLRILSITDLINFLLIAVLGVVLIAFAIRYLIKKYEDDFCLIMGLVCSICGGVALIVGVIASIDSINEVIKAFCFPELSVLEYIKELIGAS